MKNKDIIKQEIRTVELCFKDVFSVKKEFNQHLYKWQDDILYDMYDHNQFMPICDTTVQAEDRDDYKCTLEDFEMALEYQKQNKQNYFKFDTRKPIDREILDSLKNNFKIEESATYTMYLSKKHIENCKINKYVEIYDVKKENIMGELKEIERVNYGKIYGDDFVSRKIEYYLEKAKENKDFHYYGAFLKGKIAGACYAYVKNGYTLINALIVNENMRKQYVATTLMANIKEQFGGTMFLHADPEDTPKDMYGKMGFETIDIRYEYQGMLDK